MSYLNSTRLHFAGSFQANVSTVNNDPTHFDNSTFLPEYQTLQTSASLNGWFNPKGDGAWRLIGCTVTGASMPGGVLPSDPIWDTLVADSDSRATAKLVDLDPEQQIVSEIWGLQVRLTNTRGTTLLTANYDVAAFTEMWSRAAGSGGGGDMAFGAMYQSVLSDLKWGDVSHSPFLLALKTASASSGLLSIKFNVDGINLDNTAPTFMCGRIVGTIGPAGASEPRHFVQGRHFMARQHGATLGVDTALYYATAVLSAEDGKVYVDLGNSIGTTTPGGPLTSLGTINLSYVSAGKTVTLGSLDSSLYTVAPWYPQTAGVVAFPAKGKLTAEQVKTLQATPLTLSVTQPPLKHPTTKSTETLDAAISEGADGTYIRADKYVFRMNPGAGEVNNKVNVNLFATRFGLPLTGQAVAAAWAPSMLQGTQPPAPGGPPPTDPLTINWPYDALTWTLPNPNQTDANGHCVVVLSASDPGNPRQYIDGQIYGVAVSLATQPTAPGNPWNYVSVLVWNAFQADRPPTWFGSLRPIFQQYANLYPVMARFLDMGNYEAVAAHARLLTMAFALPPENPNSMPVTRDLSDSKRAAILAWLGQPGPDGKPRLGTSAAPPAPTHAQANRLVAGDLGHAAAVPPSNRLATAVPDTAVGVGGKSAALAKLRRQPNK